MRSQTFCTALSSLLALLASQTASADALSNLAILNRCYMQLTQEPMPVNDPMRAKVQGGADPVSVCINDVFRSAFLQASGDSFVVPAEREAIGKKVLQNFHLLHSSWFHFRGPGNPPVTLGNINGAMPSVYEPNAAANYFTRSLFDQSVAADYPMVATEYLRTKRDGGPITDSIYLAPTEDAKYNNFLSSGVNVMYDRGLVTGIRVLPAEQRTFPTATQDNYGRGATGYATNSISLFQHYGGGFLGLDYYLARSVDETAQIHQDGVIEVPRKWSENVYHDLMCLDLPVVRETDASSFVVPTADGPFRRSVGCTACHVSIDRMAGLIKSFEYGERRTQGVWTTWIDPTRWNKGDAGDFSWSSNYRTKYTQNGNQFSNYRKEDHVGTVYYRDCSGALIDARVDSIGALGTTLSKQMQPYVCAAKRYYKYFTGIDVDVGDPGASPLPLSPSDQVHFDFVISLAQKAFSEGEPGHFGRMSTIVEDILKSQQYRQADFGVSP